MVKMPAHYKDFPSEEETLGPQEKLLIAKMLLKRFCFLCSFEPVYQYPMGTSNVKQYYKKLNEYCILVEPLLMIRILRTAYESILSRRDEVAVVYAVYLLGDVQISWKTEMRSHFPSLVKTDNDLFLFCKYAAIIHHEKKQTVFCKTVKKAIAAWYKNQTPEAIAHMFATNRGKHGFTHRALIKMCRISDGVLGTKYLYQSFTTSCKTLLSNANCPLPPLPEQKSTPPTSIHKQKDETKTKQFGEKKESKGDVVAEPTASTSREALENALIRPVECDQEKIRSLVLCVSTLRTTTDADDALRLINEHDLKFEHLPYHLLQYPQVLKAVVKSMSCLQLIKCLHSEKIRKHFAKQEVLKACRERFQRKGGMKGERVDPIMFLMNMDRLSIVQPLKPTNNKKTSRGRLVQFSKQIYRTSFWETEPTNLRIHITINLQQSYMKKILKNTKSINYQFAAAALAFTFYKVESNCEIHRWSESPQQLLPINWHKKMDFITAYESCSEIQNPKNNQHLYVPILQANEKERIYDLFIVIVPSAARGNKENSSRTLADHIDRYRIRHNCKAKFVIVDLMRYKKSMKYSQSSCENILEICGLDEHTIPLIYNFALNKFD